MKRIAICIALTLPACTDPVDTSDPTLETAESTDPPRENPDSLDDGESENELELTSAEVAAAVAVRTEEEVAHATTDASESRFGAVELHPGFMPDPVITEGTAGGDQRAHDRDPECRGYIDEVPNHRLVTTGAMAELRLVAHSEEDITLVMLKPDGTYVCNDDASRRYGTDPMIRTEVSIGEHSIWVGSHDVDDAPSYRLGFSELPNVYPSDLRPERPTESP